MTDRREASTPTRAVSETPQPRGVAERLYDGLRANRPNRLAMVLILSFAGILAGLAWHWLEPERPKSPSSRLGRGSVVTANPLEATSDEYRSALEQGEENRREAALARGESYVPAFQSQARGPDPAVAAPVLPSAVAPSETMRAQMGVPEPATEPEVDPLLDRKYPEPQPRGTALVREDVVPVGSTPVAAVMDELLAAWNEVPKMTVIRYEAAPRSGWTNETVASAEEIAGTVDRRSGRVLVQAGRMLYAATTVGVDSELGLPVLVELLEEPLRGAVLHGEFERVRDRIVVRFTRLSDPRHGLDMRVDAYAVGLECECGAVRGEVDRHWFSRVMLPAAFGFAQEYLGAVQEPDLTIVVDGQVLAQRSGHDVSGRIARGLAGAVARTGEVVQESLPKRATVRLPRGMELAVVFVEAVEAGKEARR